MLEAYKDQSATRALQRLLSARAPSSVPSSALPTGTAVLYFYKSTKHCDPIEWRPGIVIKAEDNLVRVKTPSGRTSSVAYEDIRIRPQSDITRFLREGDVETVISREDQITTSERNKPPSEESGPQSELDSVKALIATDSEQAVPDEPAPSSLAASRDIGPHVDPVLQMDDVSGHNLASNRQHHLRTIQDILGGKQVSRGQLSFAPSWILEEAFDKEMRENWADAYEEIEQSAVPTDANIIGCHTVYKVKEAPSPESDGELTMKARNVLHGNRDKDRYSVRRDSSSADLSVVRLTISIGLMLDFSFGVADVKGAYMQSGPAKRDIFVRPPRESHVRGKIWKLLRLPYGIVEAGRQWLCSIESWMLKEYFMERVTGVEQLFVLRGAKGAINLLVAKVVDDFFITGPEVGIQRFFDHLNRSFTLGSQSIGRELKFLGCNIHVLSDKSVRVSMSAYLDRVRSVQISKERKTRPEIQVDDRERSEYRSLAGVLLYLGQAVLPQASFVASRMQQKLGLLKIGHVIEANKMLTELKKLKAELMFIWPQNIGSVSISSLSDASHGCADETYGQTGTFCGLKIQSSLHDLPLFHPIAWTSHKQRRVSYSSFGAEIIAAACADDRGYDLKMSFRSLFPLTPLRHQLLVDSKALFETLTTIHQTDVYRLRKTVARIRASFESGELESVRWIPGTANYADALTKRNLPLSAKFNNMLTTGNWLVQENRGVALDFETWA